MNRKGVSYDVGTVTNINWRPDYDPKLVHRELEIIKSDPHCTAVGITGQDIGRLVVAAEAALQQGLEVWLYPVLWDKGPEQMLAYMVKAATATEMLYARYPDQLVVVAGGELTLFMQGIVPGRTFMGRLRKAISGGFIKAGQHNAPLNAYLRKANAAVRQVFHGPVTYAALIWEQVDWSSFDFVGVDHYWAERIKGRYLDMLQPLFAFDKPVVITEFGFSTTTAPAISGALDIGHIDGWSFFLHTLPLVGPFIRPRLKQVDERDEGMQARRLIDQLTLLEGAGVDGTFLSTFIFPLKPYDDTPRYDLDREGASLVKSCAGGRHGTTYPDMPWEPKASFNAVATYYAVDCANENRK
jgi:hypothetical protein